MMDTLNFIYNEHDQNVGWLGPVLGTLEGVEVKSLDIRVIRDYDSVIV